jgi:hypothetical protein
LAVVNSTLRISIFIYVTGIYENDSFSPLIIFLYSIETRSTSPEMGIGRKGILLIESYSVQQLETDSDEVRLHF